MMLEEEKIGNKSLEPIHGSTHFLFSVEVENQLVMEFIGQLSRANKSLPIGRTRIKRTQEAVQLVARAKQLEEHHLVEINNDKFQYKGLKATIQLE